MYRMKALMLRSYGGYDDDDEEEEEYHVVRETTLLSLSDSLLRVGESLVKLNRLEETK
jgi:hypothetical protein